MSCGQLTDDEKSLGRAVEKIITAHNMTPFFAPDVHSTGALNTVIFKALQTCDAFLGILQKRGTVTFPPYDPSERSSVWIEQEIAVFSYRMFLEDRSLPIRVYSERDIRREGIMEVAIVNAIPFTGADEILADVDPWLGGPEFDEHPTTLRREQLFSSRTAGLTQDEWLAIELIAVHTERGSSIREDPVRKDFFEITGVHPRREQEWVARWTQALRRLHNADLIQNPHTEMSILPQWWQLVLDELRARGRRV